MKLKEIVTAAGAAIITVVVSAVSSVLPVWEKAAPAGSGACIIYGSGFAAVIGALCILGICIKWKYQKHKET